MRILICDDEPLARARLAKMLEQLGHDVVAQASNGEQAIEFVTRDQPDVMLLDIGMPEMNGLECARILSGLGTPPAIIFCTAYDHYAIDAFQTHAVAYLLKPVPLDTLNTALKKATKLTQAQLYALQDQVKEQDIRFLASPRQHIIAKTHRGVEFIAIEDIYYFSADQKYVLLRHKNGEVLIDDTLKELEIEFNNQFVRIHRNALLAVRYLDGLELLSNGQYQVRLKDIDTRLLISRRHLTQLKDKLQSF